MNGPEKHSAILSEVTHHESLSPVLHTVIDTGALIGPSKEKYGDRRDVLVRGLTPRRTSASSSSDERTKSNPNSEAQTQLGAKLLDRPLPDSLSCSPHQG